MQRGRQRGRRGARRWMNEHERTNDRSIDRRRRGRSCDKRASHSFVEVDVNVNVDVVMVTVVDVAIVVAIVLSVLTPAGTRSRGADRNNTTQQITGLKDQWGFHRRSVLVLTQIFFCYSRTFYLQRRS